MSLRRPATSGLMMLAVACSPFHGADESGSGAPTGGPSTAPVPGDGAADAAQVGLDGGANACAGAFFCDDFERDPLDVKGPWDDLILRGGDSPPTLVGSPVFAGKQALHFTVPSTSVTDHAFLTKTIHFEGGLALSFMLRTSDVNRHINVATLSVHNGNGESEDQYVTIHLENGNLALGSRVSAGTYEPLGFFQGFPTQTWSRISLRLDTSSSPPTVEAKWGDQSLSRSVDDVSSHSHDCTIALGADFATDGDSVERWYDDVRVEVLPL